MSPIAARFLCGLALLATAALVLATSTWGHAAGAHATWGDRGCTCHGQSPTAGVGVVGEGVSEHWEPGQAYEVTVRIQGSSPPLPMPVGRNAGGFALDFDVGTMAPKDDSTQLVGQTMTHTAAGNDRREWKFQWTAPANATTVTFKVAVNAVNGDGLNNALDQWNKKAFTYGAHPMEAPMEEPTPTPSPTKSPNVPVWAVLGAAGIGLALLRRRT